MKITFNKKMNDELIAKIERRLRDVGEDIATDIERVSQSLAPRETGHLERSVTSNVKVVNGQVTVTIGYRAISSYGHNYAYTMHNSNYRLGKESRRKKAVKSRFGSGKQLKKGRHFLTGPIEDSHAGYAEYVLDATQHVIRTDKIFKSL